MFVILDLDGTAAPVGKRATEQTVSLLHKLREKGARIALSSGKPTFYLCGFVRQMGLADAFLIGENGAVIQEGVALPPIRFEKAPLPAVTKCALRDLREKLEEVFPDRIWYQPNETALTPFPYFTEDFPAIRELLSRSVTPDMQLVVYEHPDCFDIAYRGLSKGEGLHRLSRITGVPLSDMIAVGDWTNDYPMLDAAGYAVGIHLPDPARADANFETVEEALQHILLRI